MNRKTIASLAAVVVASTTGCTSTRQIDPEKTGSWAIEGTSWRGFCRGANAFIYVPSRRDSEPDELEAIVYDDYECVARINAGRVKAGATPLPSTAPSMDADPDGIVDDED